MLTVDYLKSSQFAEVYDFLGRLADEDRQYLKYDVTNEQYVKERIASIDQKSRITIVAWNKDKQIVGEATVYWTQFGWKSHVGKLRIVVDRNYRKRGLSRYLAQLIFFEAQQHNLMKIMAEYIRPQKAAKHILEALGFKREAILKDFAVDTKGEKQDLVIMVADLERLLDKFENMVWDDEHKGG